MHILAILTRDARRLIVRFHICIIESVPPTLSDRLSLFCHVCLPRSASTEKRKAAFELCHFSQISQLCQLVKQAGRNAANLVVRQNPSKRYRESKKLSLSCTVKFAFSLLQGFIPLVLKATSSSYVDIATMINEYVLPHYLIVPI